MRNSVATPSALILTAPMLAMLPMVALFYPWVILRKTVKAK